MKRRATEGQLQKDYVRVNVTSATSTPTYDKYGNRLCEISMYLPENLISGTDNVVETTMAVMKMDVPLLKVPQCSCQVTAKNGDLLTTKQHLYLFPLRKNVDKDTLGYFAYTDYQEQNIPKYFPDMYHVVHANLQVSNPLGSTAYNITEREFQTYSEYTDELNVFLTSLFASINPGTQLSSPQIKFVLNSDNTISLHYIPPLVIGNVAVPIIAPPENQQTVSALNPLIQKCNMGGYIHDGHVYTYRVTDTTSVTPQKATGNRTTTFASVRGNDFATANCRVEKYEFEETTPNTSIVITYTYVLQYTDSTREHEYPGIVTQKVRYSNATITTLTPQAYQRETNTNINPFIDQEATSSSVVTFSNEEMTPGFYPGTPTIGPETTTVTGTSTQFNLNPNVLTVHEPGLVPGEHDVYIYFKHLPEGLIEIDGEADYPEDLQVVMPDSTPSSTSSRDYDEYDSYFREVTEQWVLTAGSQSELILVKQILDPPLTSVDYPLANLYNYIENLQVTRDKTEVDRRIEENISSDNKPIEYFSIAGNKEFRNMFPTLPWTRIVKNSTFYNKVEDGGQWVAEKETYPSDLFTSGDDEIYILNSQEGNLAEVTTKEFVYRIADEEDRVFTTKEFVINFTASDAVTISSISSFVLTMSGVVINQEVFPVNFSEETKATAQISTIPIIENYLPLIAKPSDLSTNMIISRTDFSNAAPIKINPSVFMERYLKFKMWYITKNGQMKEMLLPDTQPFTFQICFCLTRFII